MRQIVQDIRAGGLNLVECPDAVVVPGYVLIANRFSVISSGTERTARRLAGRSLVGKALERPDHVRRVIQKARREGLSSTLRQVREKLHQPMAMGYCSAGVVVACGAGVEDLQPGDRVASNGPHAELVSVPRHLCAPVPRTVPLDQASLTVLGAVALQGIRLAGLELGGTALVVGLGLVGQLTVGLLQAAGVRTFATDLQPWKCDTAAVMGAATARANLTADDVRQATAGAGVDAVLLTASTPSDSPLRLAADAVRARGRVVAVGEVGLNVPRRAFYFKETELVVSRSYGPGRYDPTYEEGGVDYPAEYVRWTAERNFGAVLEMMASGRLEVQPLLTRRFPLEQAAEAYALLQEPDARYLGLLLEYPEVHRPVRRVVLRPEASPLSGAKVGVGCIGAGQHALATLFPAMQRVGTLAPRVVATSGGQSGRHAAERFRFEAAVSGADQVCQDPKVDLVLVLTRHDAHARHAVAALAAGKHTFVEKPLCLSHDELDEVERAYHAASPARTLMVGFNRRFAPATLAVRAAFADCGPLAVSIRFNAGALPADHWLLDPARGGGRLLGEACHAFDLAACLTDSPIVRVHANATPSQPGGENVHVLLKHENGSISNVTYLSDGDPAHGKERVEVSGGGMIAEIRDFRSAVLSRGGKRRTLWRGRQNKGHTAMLASLADSILKGGPPPIEWEMLRATTRATLLAVDSLRQGVPHDVEGPTVVSTETRRAG